MSREIKFRAWDKEAHKMDNVIMLGEEFCSLKDTGSWDRNRLELMQYTGLKDSNGKEIWEGDIVRYEQFVGEVVWDYSGLMLKVSNVIYAIWRGCEVIGNIYENPELLEG